MKKLSVVMVWMCLMLFSPGLSFSENLPALSEARQKIGEEFSKLDSGMKDAARQLGASGLTGEAARASLKGLCGKFAFAIDCSTVNTRGILVTVEPSAFKQVEGSDISAQEHLKLGGDKPSPVMSSAIKMVEGFFAVDVEYPVIGSDGKYIGCVSLIFKPEELLSRIVPPLLSGVPVDIWVMEPEGRILYDTDSSEIGRNLFTSPDYRSYPELLKLGHRIAVNPEGDGSYRYRAHGESSLVTKTAHWESIAFYGASWRVVGIHVQKDKSGSKVKRNAPAMSLEEKFDTLAANDRLARALSKNNRNAAISLFKRFYKTTRGIYAIEWIDENGINRFGYPAVNSLTDYDCRKNQKDGDQKIIDILDKRRKDRLELPLMEGGRGLFDFAPVMKGDRYLGMIYIIRLK